MLSVACAGNGRLLKIVSCIRGTLRMCSKTRYIFASLDAEVDYYQKRKTYPKPNAEAKGKTQGRLHCRRRDRSIIETSRGSDPAVGSETALSCYSASQVSRLYAANVDILGILKAWSYPGFWNLIFARGF